MNNNGSVGTPLAYNAQATSSQTDETAAQQFEANDVSAHIGLLKAGTNLLAVHGLNSTARSRKLIPMPPYFSGNTSPIQPNPTIPCHSSGE